MNITHEGTGRIEPTCRSVDWRAAILAGLTAGLLAFGLMLYFVPAAVGAGNAAAIVRYMASVVAGPAVLAPPATFTPLLTLLGVGVHFAVSMGMAVCIAYVLHRWGLITGILGGAAFGLFFFAIIYFSLTLFLPHFYAMNHWSVVLVHAVFGAVAGGVYEILEREPGERLAMEGH